jgi:carbon storage regulator CsrA
MLVLTRSENDQILIPALGIKLQVLSIRGKNVKIGIEAPKAISIVRGELVLTETPTRLPVVGTALAALANQVEPKFDQVKVNQVNGDQVNGDQVLPLQSFISNVARRKQEALASTGVDYSIDSPSSIVRESRVGYEMCI